MPLAWLKPEQVAELLQVSVRFVQELIRLGEIPAYAIGESGKVKRVYYNDLMDYMAEHRTPAPAETH
jgi:excisionase family DNA binding protein